jgi:hypothetical protein
VIWVMHICWFLEQHCWFVWLDLRRLLANLLACPRCDATAGQLVAGVIPTSLDVLNVDLLSSIVGSYAWMCGFCCCSQAAAVMR